MVTTLSHSQISVYNLRRSAQVVDAEDFLVASAHERLIVRASQPVLTPRDSLDHFPARLVATALTVIAAWISSLA